MSLPLEKRFFRALKKKIGVNLTKPSVGDLILDEMRKPINKAADNFGASMERAKTQGCAYDQVGAPIVDAIADSRILTRFAENLRKRGPSGGKILYSDDKRYKK